MTRQPFNLDPLSAERPGASATGGLTMADMLLLPEPQRQLVNWMMRQETVSLATIAAYTDEPEAAIRPVLEDLIEQGFVQEIEEAGEIVYRLQLGTKRGRSVPEELEQSLAPGNPLAIITNPSGDQAVVPGTTVELYITVINKGNQSALIDVFIDEVSQVYEWCASPRERLALGSQQSGEVVFQFEVPPQALSGTYNYSFVIDAPRHYPEETPIRFARRLQVLPSMQGQARGNDPTFVVQPTTNSTEPIAIQPGATVPVQILVHNRSDRVDRFRLTCTDLDPTWFTVRYPDNYTGSGLPIQTEALDLNPGEKGQITLLFHPVRYTLAGNYCPTIRLYSANNPTLLLLDLIYLELLPVYDLTAEMRTIVGKIKRKAGLYDIKLTNQGNTVRDVFVRINKADEEDSCAYTLATDQVQVLPGETSSVGLRVKPKQWWHRPLVGPKLFNFTVEFEDTKQLPPPNYLPQGMLMWQPRPWWQVLPLYIFGLIVFLTVVLLLWRLFFLPPVLPKVVDFAPVSTTYREVDGDRVHLNWRVSYPWQVKEVRLSGQTPDGQTVSDPITYNFSRGIPPELKSNCKIQTVLVCQNVSTDARRSGDYVFELTVIPKSGPGEPADTRKTSLVQIQPAATPQVVALVPTQPVYLEPRFNPKAPPAKPNQPQGVVLLNWEISHPNQLRELNLIGRSPEGLVTSTLQRYDFSRGIPDALQANCQVQETLICKNVATDAKNPGDHIFDLTVVPRKVVGDPPVPHKSDVIKVQPLPPQIVQLKLEGQEAPPKFMVPISQPNTLRNLALAWKVEGNPGIKVELLPTPGPVPLEGTMAYPISLKPGQETITLQASNAYGQQTTRVVTIEIFDPTQPAPPPPPPEPPVPPAPAPNVPEVAPGAAPGSGGSLFPGLGLPRPVEPGSVSPSELPPQTD